MSKSFLRGRRPSSKRGATEQKDGGSAPPQPVPLPIGNHRASAPPATDTAPASISQMQSWKASRPSAAPGQRAGLLGGARGRVAPQQQREQGPGHGYGTRVEAEETPYNTDEIEQKESEGEAPDHYANTPSAHHDARPRHGYGARVEAEETPYNTDEVEQKESENEADIASDAANSPVPAVTQRIQQASEPTEEEKAREQAKEKQDARLAKAAVAARHESPKGAKAPEKVPAVRHHRAWMVSMLGRLYNNELEEQRPGLLEAARGLGRSIGRYYQAIDELARLAPDDLEGLAAVKASFQDGSPIRDAETVEKAREAAEKRYQELSEQAIREELPIYADGSVDEDVLAERMVSYDEDPDIQAKSAVLVGDKLLYRSDGTTPVDTKDGVTHVTGIGAEIFVVGTNNEIHMASHKIGKFHHSSLLGGMPVSMAGEMKVTNGTIEWISNKSGHYCPTTAQLQQFLHHLGKDVPLDFEVRSMGKTPAFPDGTTALKVLSGVDKDGKDDTTLGYERVKTQAVIKEWIAMIGDEAVEKVMEDNGWELYQITGYEVEDQDGNPVDDRAVRRALKAAYPDMRARTVRPA